MSDRKGANSDQPLDLVGWLRECSVVHNPGRGFAHPKEQANVIADTIESLQAEVERLQTIIRQHLDEPQAVSHAELRRSIPNG